jgi:hypothetical protein
MPACDSNAEQYDTSAWFEIVLVAVRCQRRAGQVRADVVRGQSMPEQEGQVGCGQRAVNAGTGRSGLILVAVRCQRAYQREQSFFNLTLVFEGA